MKKILFAPFLLLPFLLNGCAGQSVEPVTPDVPESVTPPPVVQESAPQIPTNLIVIGEIEYVTILQPETLKMAARIDTGATTSSIGAAAIKEYERDGKKWVKFTITDPQTKKSMELKRPVVRTIEVKQHGKPAQQRLVVSLPIAMGSIEQKTEFSLADRSTFKYPVLIGRSFLRGVAVVDVNQEYLLAPLGMVNEK